MSDIHFLDQLDCLGSITKNEIIRGRLDELLAWSVASPTELLRVMDQVNAFITGSVALSFFDGPGKFAPRTLDISTPQGTVTDLTNHFIKVEGFVEDDSSDVTSFLPPHCNSVCRLRREFIHVNIMESDHPQLGITSIPFTWSPILRNIVGPGIYCAAYPDAIRRRTALVLKNQWETCGSRDGKIDGEIAEAMWRYADRGFNIQLQPSDEEQHNEATPGLWRFMGDAHCLMSTCDEFQIGHDTKQSENPHQFVLMERLVRWKLE